MNDFCIRNAGFKVKTFLKRKNNKLARFVIEKLSLGWCEHFFSSHMYSQLSKCSMASGSSTGFFRVSPTKVKAR